MSTEATTILSEVEQEITIINLKLDVYKELKKEAEAEKEELASKGLNVILELTLSTIDRMNAKIEALESVKDGLENILKRHG